MQYDHRFGAQAHGIQQRGRGGGVVDGQRRLILVEAVEDDLQKGVEGEAHPVLPRHPPHVGQLDGALVDLLAPHVGGRHQMRVHAIGVDPVGPQIMQDVAQIDQAPAEVRALRPGAGIVRGHVAGAEYANGYSQASGHRSSSGDRCG